MAQYTVTLKKLIKELSLEAVYLPKDEEQLFIYSAEVNRPGLHLSGFVEYFEPSRVQITGKMEFAYFFSFFQKNSRVGCNTQFAGVPGND